MPDQKSAWQESEGEAAKWLLTAVAGALVTGVGNYFRSMMMRRRVLASHRTNERDAIQNIAEMKQIIAPDAPNKDDIRTLIQAQQSQIDALRAGQQSTHERIDDLQSEGVRQYTNLCNLIISTHQAK